MQDIDDGSGAVPWESYEEDVRTARNTLSFAIGILNLLVEDALAGALKSGTELPAKASELGAALRKASEIEERLNDWLDTRDTRAGRGTLDLSAARAEIDRRLDRLERCLGADGAAVGDE